MLSEKRGTLYNPYREKEGKACGRKGNTPMKRGGKKDNYGNKGALKRRGSLIRGGLFI